MTVDRAIMEALRFETSIRDLYVDAARRSGDEAAREFYRALGADEQSHVAYLEHKLAEWKRSGIVTFEGLASGLPEPGRIEAAVREAGAGLEGSRAGRTLGGQIEALARALESEERTTAFYESQAGLLEGAATRLFDRFVAIERGHERIVRAELDLASRTGRWFDFREFDLED